jgi:hypothetical protein
VPAPWPWTARGGALKPAYLATPATIPAAIFNELATIRQLLRPTGPIGAAPTGWDTSQDVFEFSLRQNQAWLGGASTTLRFAQAMQDELCLQRDNDLQWARSSSR